MKARKSLENISLLPLELFSLFVIEYVFCGIGIHSLINPSIFWISCKYCSDLNQIEIQLTCKLCTDDSKPNSITNLSFKFSLKCLPAPIFRSLFIFSFRLYDNRLLSCFSYLVIISLS